MGKQFKKLSRKNIDFIKEQKVFFIASCANSEVNLSPKGHDCIHIIDENSLYMMDYLGSGNRTARDVEDGGEVTLLFCSYGKIPKITRCFCNGEIYLKDNPEFDKVSKFFNEDMNAVRQIFKFSIYAVETSCGDGVPIMEYVQERPKVRDFALRMYNEGKFDEYERDHHTPPNLKTL
jgi:hypothetical protein